MSKLKELIFGRSATGPVEYLVVGLGNPGKKYENTRHNAGFIAVDSISESVGCKVNKIKFQSLCGDCSIAGKRALLMKPTTYMNLSGQSVREAMQFYKIPVSNVIVISDDVSLNPGQMRIRRSGSDGGQKGLRSIIALTGQQEFPRIRIGIGAKPHPQMELADWVLSQFSKQDQVLLKPVFEQTQTAIELMVQGKIDEAMNRFN